MNSDQVSKKVQDRIKANFSEYDLKCYSLMSRKLRIKYSSYINYLAKKNKKDISPSDYIKQYCRDDDVFYQIQGSKKQKRSKTTTNKIFTFSDWNPKIKDSNRTRELESKIMALWQRPEFILECKGVQNG